MILQPDTSPKSALQFLWSRDGFHGNKVQEYVNTRLFLHCAKFGEDWSNTFCLFVIYVIFCENELQPGLKYTEMTV